MAHQSPTARTAGRLSLVAAVLAAFTLSLMAFAGPVLGSSVTGAFVSPSTNSCDDDDIGLTGLSKEINAPNFAAGATTYSGAWGDLAVNFDADHPNTSEIVSFSSPDYYVKAVVIQGSGNNGGTMAWKYAGAGVTGDTSLQVASDSHFVQVIFCFGDAVAAPPSGGSLPDSAIGQTGGVSPISTVLFTGALLSALAGLAFANVKGARSRS